MVKRLLKCTAVLSALAVVALTAVITGKTKILAENNYIVSDSRWKLDEQAVKPGDTSEGILVDIKDEYDRSEWQYNYYFTYTIPEDYKGGEIHINLISDLEKHYDGATYMPGDGENFYVNIINRSDTEYEYSKGSLQITDGNYADTEGNEELYVKGAVTFSNRPVKVTSTVWRTSNSALKELMGLDKKNNSSRYYTDEIIDSSLKQSGYVNGLEDIDRYYVDFLNKKYDTNNSKLEQFSVDQLCKYVFDGYKINVREKDKEIAELGYNVFYNNLLSLTMDDVTVSDEDCLSGRYSFGSWMRNENNADEYMNSKVGLLNAGMIEAKDIINAHLHLNGPYTTNPYQQTSWGMEFAFSLSEYVSPAEPETQERESDTPTLPEEDTEPSVQEESATAHNETAHNEVAADEEVVKTADSKAVCMYTVIVAVSAIMCMTAFFYGNKREIKSKEN